MTANNKCISDTANHIIKLKKELNMKIIEPFTSDIIEFENAEQFNEYINKDLEKYTRLTTQKLNKMFHIPSYRITKINKAIGLRKYRSQNSLVGSYTDENKLKALTEMVDTIINDLIRIDNELNNMKAYVKYTA